MKLLNRLCNYLSRASLLLTPTSGMWLNKFDSHLSKSLHRASWIQGGLKIASFLSAGFYFKRLDIHPATLALLFWCLHEPRSWRPCHACRLADSSHQLQNIPTSDTAEDEKQHRSSEEILKYSSPHWYWCHRSDFSIFIVIFLLLIATTLSTYCMTHFFWSQSCPPKNLCLFHVCLWHIFTIF